MSKLVDRAYLYTVICKYAYSLDDMMLCVSYIVLNKTKHDTFVHNLCTLCGKIYFYILS